MNPNIGVGCSQYRNVWFCGCGRRLLRSEFLEMGWVKKFVRGRTKNIRLLVVKEGVKQCFHCEKGVQA